MKPRLDDGTIFAIRLIRQKIQACSTALLAAKHFSAVEEDAVWGIRKLLSAQEHLEQSRGKAEALP